MLKTAFTYLFLFLVVPHIVGAQSFSDAGIEIRLNPTNPRPNQEVTATISSFTENIQSSNVVWLLDRVPVARGDALDTFTFTTGESGSLQTLGIIVTTLDGRVIQKERSLRPALVDIFVEPQTYVPPFFKGRSLFSGGSALTYYALADLRDELGNAIPESELIYTWQDSERTLLAQSGRGRSSLTRETSQLFPNGFVIVDVSTLDGSQTARSGIEVPVIEPKVTLYATNPLLGVIRSTALSVPIATFLSDIGLHAVAYYTSTSDTTDSALTYLWLLDGVNLLPGGENSPTVNIQSNTSETFSGVLTVGFEHATNVLQSTTQVIEVLFNRDSGGSVVDLQGEVIDPFAE